MPKAVKDRRVGKKGVLIFISRQISSGEHTVCQRPAETRAAHATEPAQGARKAREFLSGKHPARNPVPLLWARDNSGSFTSRQHKGTTVTARENELHQGGWATPSRLEHPGLGNWRVTETQQEPEKRRSQALTVSLMR